MAFGTDDTYGSTTHGKYRPKSDMRYDGAAAQVFFTCLLGLLCVSVTWGRWRHLIRQRKVSAEHERALCPCRACRSRRHAKIAQKRRSERLKRLVVNGVLLGLWLLFLFAVVFLYRSVSASLANETPFDPYEVLGVSRNADREQIVRAYRKRSLELHPDKNLQNPNYQPEAFVRLNKAYRVLTDPVALENYQKYGNPDGYQGTRYGIALPSWLVDRGTPVLLGYALVLLAGLPLGVGMWWRRRAHLLSESVSQETYALFAEFLGQPTAIKFRNLPEVYGAALEFATRTPFEAECGDREAISLLCQALETGGRFDHREQRLFNRGLPHFTMNNVLLHAHLARIELDRFPVDMTRMKQNVEVLLAHVDSMIPAMVDVAGATPRPEVMRRYQRVFSTGGYIDRVLRIIQLEQSLCQAMLPSESELLQLPWFGLSEVKVCATSRRFGADGIRTIAELRERVWEPDVLAMLASQGPSALFPIEAPATVAKRCIRRSDLQETRGRHGAATEASTAPCGLESRLDTGAERLLRCNWDGTRLRSLLRMFSDAQLDDIHLFLIRYPRKVQLQVVEPYVVDQDRAGEADLVRDPRVHAGDITTLEVHILIERLGWQEMPNRTTYYPCCSRLPFDKNEHWWMIVGDRKMNSIVAVRRLHARQAVQQQPGSRQAAASAGEATDARDMTCTPSPPTSASSRTSTQTDASDTATSGSNNIGDRDGASPVAASGAREYAQPTDKCDLAPYIRREALSYSVQFMAPPQVGTCKLVVHALPDCYFGLNRHVQLDVDIHEHKPPEPEMHYFDPSDLSEDDDDRPTGQARSLTAEHTRAVPASNGEQGVSSERTSTQQVPNDTESAEDTDSSADDAFDIDGEAD
jgi:hypothetical protein